MKPCRHLANFAQVARHYKCKFYSTFFPNVKDNQLLLNYYCNNHMNFEDGTCCKTAEPVGTAVIASLGVGWYVSLIASLGVGWYVSLIASLGVGWYVSLRHWASAGTCR